MAAGQRRRQEAEIKNFKKATNDMANSFGEEQEPVVVHHHYYENTGPVRQSYANVEEEVVHHQYYSTGLAETEQEEHYEETYEETYYEE